MVKNNQSVFAVRYVYLSQLDSGSIMWGHFASKVVDCDLNIHADAPLVHMGRIDLTQQLRCMRLTVFACAELCAA